MSTNVRFDQGDVVVHPKRPQWGSGIVRQTTRITHQGQSAQRLIIDFANHGRVTLNTAIAQLTAKDASKAMSTNTTDKGWLEELEHAQGFKTHELWELPDTTTNPFASERARLLATLDTYRWSTEARSLIDWAVTQTGLNDPMTKYTRQELEQNFQRFAHKRDQHLKELVQNIKRLGEKQVLQQVMSEVKLPAAREALKKATRF